MIPKECKRLADVRFQMVVISRNAVRYKSIRHGPPTTLHLWWEEQPLASCRAGLLTFSLSSGHSIFASVIKEWGK